jgi:hypothetical protein
MRRGVPLVLSAAVLLALGSARADEPKEKGAGPLVLKVMVRKDKHTWDAGGKTPKEFRKELEDLAAAEKEKPGSVRNLPDPPAVDLVLQVVNTGKEDVAVFVGGDANVYTLELKGPGVVTLANPVPQTLEFRGSEPVALRPGKSYDIPKDWTILVSGTVPSGQSGSTSRHFPSPVMGRA